MSEQVHHVSLFSVFAEEDGSTVATSADAIGCEEIHVEIAQDLEFTSGRYFYISHGIEFEISIVVLCLQTDTKVVPAQRCKSFSRYGGKTSFLLKVFHLSRHTAPGLVVSLLSKNS
jgi:hypothetical protein